MNRELTMIITGNCSSCPWCQYDGYYSRNKDSGYDCRHPDSPVNRIVDDWDISNDNNKNPKGWTAIPENCPLTKIE
jgi:hypothetical protein